jgi:cysteine desulfurase
MIYLDHNATTPIAEPVLDAMLPFLRESFGNASSRHELGTHAREAVEAAREQVAAAVGVQPVQVVFTSGGTEANNLLIKGAAGRTKPAQVAVSAIEHPCVREPAKQLVRQGWTFAELGVEAEGTLRLSDVTAALSTPTGIVSVMLANNETGAIQPVAAIGEQARAAGAVMHSDAVQALGKMPVRFAELNVDAMTVSSHKIYGPKGAGALIVDKRLDLLPLLAGGGHERGARSGTENVAAIVGFGVACELAQASLDARERMVAQAKKELLYKAAPGREIRELQVSATDFAGMTYTQVLLPVWLGSYQYRGKRYRMLVNGQTGRVAGHKPTDSVKVSLVILGVVIALVLLSFVLVIALRPALGF